jgi:hypothetical protein
VWNAAKPAELTSRELRAALMKILCDITPIAEAWIEKLTRHQTRALLATGRHDELGYATEALLSGRGRESEHGIAGVRPSPISS